MDLERFQGVELSEKEEIMDKMIKWITNTPDQFGYCQAWSAAEAWAFADEIKGDYAHVEVRFRMATEEYLVFAYPRKVKES